MTRWQGDTAALADTLRAQPGVEDACVVDTVRAGHPYRVAFVAPVPGGQPAASPAATMDGPRVTAACATAAREIPSDLDPLLLARVDRLAVRAMFRALTALGAFTADRPRVDVPAFVAAARILPRYTRLVRAWMRALVNEGVLAEVTPDVFEQQTQIDADVDAEWTALEDAAPTAAALVAYLRRCSSRLDVLLRGEDDPVQLLFPGASVDVANDLYRLNPVSRYLNGIARAAVHVAAGGPGAGMRRALEIGAGTGGTTDELVDRFNGARLTYHFTDVAPFFLTRARARYRDVPAMRFGLFDINRDAAGQGMDHASFSVIVAANSLHYAHDVRDALDRVKRLLVPGGWLVAIESTRQTPWQLISIGFLDGVGAADDRADAAIPLLSEAEWTAALAAAGFEEVQAFGGDAALLPGDPVAGRVFVARAPIDASIACCVQRSLWDAAAAAHDARDLPDRLILLPALPRTPDGAVDTAALAAAVAEPAPTHPATAPTSDLERLIVSVLCEVLDRGEVGIDQNFFDLGADSLAVARASELLAARLGRAVPVVDLFAHPDVRALARHLGAEPTDAVAGRARDRARKRQALMANRSRAS